MASRLLTKTALLTTTILASGSAAVAQSESEPAGSLQPVEEIVVTGDFIPDEKRGTSEIANVLDADDFTRTGDSDMAAALQRVTGLSLVEGKYVFVRGLGKRYSNATLDGSPLPSPEPLSRVIPLDIFPTSFIGNTLVQKTFSPEYPAQFGGGIIALRTKRLPEERRFRVSVSAEANSVTTFSDGLALKGGSLDFLGIDNGYRSIPDLLAQDPNLEQFPTNSAEREAIGEALPNAWSPDNEPLPPGVGLAFNYDDRFDFSDMSVGVQLGLSYDSSLQNRNGIRQVFALEQGEVAVNESYTPEACVENLAPLNRTQPGVVADFVDGCGVRSTVWEIGLNGFLNVGVDFGNNHSIKATQLLLRQTTRESVIEQGIDFEGDPRSSVRNDWIERQVWFSQLNGDHFVNLFDNDWFAGDLEIQWRASYAAADRDTPFRRTYDYVLNEATGLLSFDPQTEGNRTVFGELSDDQYGAGLDFIQPMNWFGRPVDVKLGYAYEKKDRESAFRRYFFDNFGDLNRQVIPEFIFTEENIGPDGLTLFPIFQPSDAFTADFRNHQAYIGLDAQVIDTVRVALGGRFEDSVQTAESFGLVNEQDVLRANIDETYFLPAVTVTWEFAQNMQLRGAFSQTISRPDLREIADTQFLDPERNRFIRGNPDLVNSELTNFDVRWEWYFGRRDQMTLGAFYKEIKNPIERAIRIEGSNRVISFFNRAFVDTRTGSTDVRLQGGLVQAQDLADVEIFDTEADLIGVEFELVKYYDVSDLVDWQFFEDRELYLIGNFSYIDSEVNIDESVVDELQLSSATRRLQGQSEIIVNAQIGFEDFLAGEKLAVVLNWQSERLQEVGTLGRPDIFERPPIMVDFVYSREFDLGETPMQVRFSAQNLLNEEEFLSQGGETTENFQIGRTFSISLSAEF
ncbi:hypothetical protein CCR85_09075 [Rhodothalassium salexigens]|nr:hypothetical protein [Rhodothalassium salexigens]